MDDSGIFAELAKLGNEAKEEDQVAKSKRLQEKHYKLLKDLQKMAAEIPIKYQQRLPYELLSDLANCLIDDTIGMIVKGLKDIQEMTEKTLFEKRQKTENGLKLKKSELEKRLKSEMALNLLTQEEVALRERNFEKEMEETLKKFDMKAILDLDQVVSEQQVTLEKSGVPGFHVTNKSHEVQLQMYILEFILKIVNQDKESR